MPRVVCRSPVSAAALTMHVSSRQIPGSCIISGDVRVTPFYEVESIQTALTRCVLGFERSCCCVCE